MYNATRTGNIEGVLDGKLTLVPHTDVYTKVTNSIPHVEKLLLQALRRIILAGISARRTLLEIRSNDKVNECFIEVVKIVREILSGGGYTTIDRFSESNTKQRCEFLNNVTALLSITLKYDLKLYLAAYVLEQNAYSDERTVESKGEYSPTDYVRLELPFTRYYLVRLLSPGIPTYVRFRKDTFSCSSDWGEGTDTITVGTDMSESFDVKTGHFFVGKRKKCPTFHLYDDGRILLDMSQHSLSSLTSNRPNRTGRNFLLENKRAVSGRGGRGRGNTWTGGTEALYGDQIKLFIDQNFSTPRNLYGPFRRTVWNETTSEMLNNNLALDSSATQRIGKRVVYGDSLEAEIRKALRGQKNILICGIGFSGTGKTHTLFGAKGNTNEESIFDRAYKLILEGGYKIVGKDQPKITEEYFSNDIKHFSKPEGVIINHVSNDVNHVEKLRRLDNRIRRSQNNPNSSRSHLYVTYALQNNNKSFKLTIMDAAGRENPAKLAEDFSKALLDKKFCQYLVENTPDNVPVVSSISKLTKNEGKQSSTCSRLTTDVIGTLMEYFTSAFTKNNGINKRFQEKLKGEITLRFVTRFARVYPNNVTSTSSIDKPEPHSKTRITEIYNAASQERKKGSTQFNYINIYNNTNLGVSTEKELNTTMNTQSDKMKSQSLYHVLTRNHGKIKEMMANENNDRDNSLYDYSPLNILLLYFEGSYIMYSLRELLRFLSECSGMKEAQADSLTAKIQIDSGVAQCFPKTYEHLSKGIGLDPTNTQVIMVCTTKGRDVVSETSPTLDLANYVSDTSQAFGLRSVMNNQIKENETSMYDAVAINGLDNTNTTRKLGKHWTKFLREKNL